MLNFSSFTNFLNKIDITFLKFVFPFFSLQLLVYLQIVKVKGKSNLILKT